MLYLYQAPATALFQKLPPKCAVQIERLDPKDVPDLKQLAKVQDIRFQPGDTVLWQQAANDAAYLVTISESHEQPE